MRLYATTAPGARLEDDGRLLLYSTSSDLARPVPQRGHAPRPVTWTPTRCWRAPRRSSRIAPGTACGSPRTPTPISERSALDAGYAVDLPHWERPAWPSTTASTAGPRRARRTSPSTRSPTTTARLDYLAVTVDAYADYVPAPRRGRGTARHRWRAVRGPDVRAVVARRDGRPVAAAMVVASGAVAGIQLVGTIPDARGRGLGELCTRWAVAAGFELGARGHRARGVGGGRAALPAPGIRGGVALPLVLRAARRPAGLRRPDDGAASGAPHRPRHRGATMSETDEGRPGRTT